MRLIDADELLKGQFIHVCNGRKQPATIFASDVELSPTIEAEPVVHARWELNSPFTGNCSNCGADGNRKQKRCGDCGAHMDANKMDAPERKEGINAHGTP